MLLVSTFINNLNLDMIETRGHQCNKLRRCPILPGAVEERGVDDHFVRVSGSLEDEE